MHLDIPQEDAGVAVLDVARQAHVQILGPGRPLDGVVTPAIKGDFDVVTALELMFKGTDLDVSRLTDGIIMIAPTKRPQKSEKETAPGKSGRMEATSWLAEVFSPGEFTQSAVDSALETVTVTGYRATLESALNTKRLSMEMVDVINAEDIGKFPDANLAESLQRVPGVSITRDNGEGRTITVRGLGADFTRVTINGMEALATAGGTLSNDFPNRSRQFDFNTIASELFSTLKVQKTAAAWMDEGSLGATVALTTAHPFDYGQKFVLSLNNAAYETGQSFNPRIAGLVSKTFFGGKAGVLLSVAYNMRNQKIDYFGYMSGAGQYVYYGNNIQMNVAGTPNGTISRDGFASPAGTTCSGSDGVVPDLAVTNAAYCAALSGSDPASYAAVNSPRGHNAATDATGAWLTQAPSNEFGDPQLVDQEIYQSRLGLTSSVQLQPDDSTLVTFDGLFSSFYQKSTSNLVTWLGWGRNNTNTMLNAATASTDLSSVFSTCTPYDAADSQVAAGLRAPQVCAYPNSMLPAAYFTTLGSPGYRASDPNGMLYLISTIGRPATKLMTGHVNNGIVDYVKLDNVDDRTSADQSRATTQFTQATLLVRHYFSDKFRADAAYGIAISRNHQEGLMASMEKFDVGGATGDGNYVYDLRTSNYSPRELSFGFDVNDSTEWDFVKGYSALRRYLFLTNNKYANLVTNWSYQPFYELTLRFGFSSKIFELRSSRYVRAVDTTINPSLAELGVTAADVMRSVSFAADSLGMGGGTPTAFAVPDLDKFAQYTQFRCNCVNKWGDWTISNLNSQNSGSNRTTTFNVTEHDKSYYLQADIQNINILGGELRGNVGLRYATTDVESTGYSVAGYAAKATHSYDDILPSLNLVYSITDDMLIRVGLSKVMSRPVLANMTPTVGVATPGSTLGASGILSAGNPYLKPFRANTIDLSYEWYFGKGSVLSVAAFAKYVKNNPQSQTTTGPLSSLTTQDVIEAIASNYATGSVQYQNIYNPGVTWSLTSYQNAPGGVLRGVELNYQQQFSFLPGPFDGFGVNANYTYVQSKVHYLFRDGTSTALTDHIAPWFGSSPNSFNATLYYTADDWEARLSGSYRSRYVDSYPVRLGAYPVGYGTSFAVNEFIYGKSSLYLDSSASYNISDHLMAKIDAMNLTDQHSEKYWLYQNKTPLSIYNAVTGRLVFVGLTLKY